MKIRVFLSWLLSIYLAGLGTAQTDHTSSTLLMEQRAQYAEINDSIFSEYRGFFGKTVEEKANQDLASFIAWKATYFENLKDKMFIVDSNEEFVETHTKELLPFELDNSNLEYLKIPLILENGETLEIYYGITKSDGKSANQRISEDLISGLKFIISQANRSLLDEQKPQIQSIYIMCTTNGTHSKTSNHYYGQAIDLSRINGVKIINSRYSYRLEKLLKDEIAKALRDERDFINLRNKTYTFDEIYLYSRVEALQLAIQDLASRRENFGPLFKTKFSRELEKNNLFYEVGGHEDHIHLSVRK